MLDRHFRSGRVRDRILRNLLGEHLAALADHLDRRGHTTAVVQTYVQAAEHFGYWLKHGAGGTSAEVDAEVVRRFVARHLPRCRCPAPRSRVETTVRAALHHLLFVMGAGRPNATPPTPVDSVSAGFDSHLATTCGLAAPTRLYYLRYVREFLVSRYGVGPVDLRTLSVNEVPAFVRRRAAGLAPGSANVIATAMRSFLRYLRLLGVGDWAWTTAVPRAAHWRLATLPSVLTDNELSSFLAAFDRTTATGRRGYAIGLCFTQMGLRVGEVARLALDDIDWRGRVLTLAPGKTKRASQLPLHASVARALADYLRHGRPPTPSRVIFVHHRAPRGVPLGASGIRAAVRVGYVRADLDPRWTGTHVLRHTSATRMLRAGISLKEIADVLGHRSLDTSAIYAKVDRAALSEVAMPWPEVRP